MWSVCFACLAVFVVALENVNASDYREFFKRLNSLRNPDFINSREQRIYIEKRDLSSSESPGSSEDARGSSEDARGSSEEQFPKVRIDVYYETNCIDSMRFITEQLYPLYREMGEIMDIHFYPYGKVDKYFDEENKEMFSCQHGASECYGNSVQACALKLTPNFDDAFIFIDCMERYPTPSENGPECARKHGLEWEKIEQCVNSKMGYSLMIEMAEKTERYPVLYYIPWVVFDNVFDDDDLSRTTHNLKAVVCKKYKGHHDSCTDA